MQLECCHFPRKNLPKVTLKLHLGLTIILFSWPDGEVYEKCTGVWNDFEEKVKSMWLMKCLVFYSGKDWKTKTGKD